MWCLWKAAAGLPEAVPATITPVCSTPRFKSIPAPTAPPTSPAFHAVSSLCALAPMPSPSPFTVPANWPAGVTLMAFSSIPPQSPAFAAWCALCALSSASMFGAAGITKPAPAVAPCFNCSTIFSP